MQSSTQVAVEQPNRLAELERQAHDLLRRHRARNPQDEAIAKLIGRYKRTIRRFPDAFVLACSPLSQLHLAVGDPVSSLEVLGKLAQRSEENAKKAALSGAIDIFTSVVSSAKKFIKKYPKGGPDRDRFIRLARRLLRACPPGFESNRLAVYLAVFRAQYDLALKLAVDNVSGGALGIDDLVMVITRVLSSGRASTFWERVGQALRKMPSRSGAGRHQPFIQLISLRYANAPDTRRNLDCRLSRHDAREFCR